MFKFILQIYRDVVYIQSIDAKHRSQQSEVLVVADVDLSAERDDSVDVVQLSEVAVDISDDRATQFLREMYPVMQTVMKQTLSFDLDNDCMIENSGFPDQTYDIWVAEGCHAYSGGLWVAACIAMDNGSRILADDVNNSHYAALERKAQLVYVDKLWNGVYLNYDNSKSDHHDSIMADMLADQWFSHACRLSRTVVASDIAFSCLKTIYVGRGALIGAVNGMCSGLPGEV